MQKDSILDMILALKAAGKPLYVVEKEIGFYNGLLGNIVKGKTQELSDERFLKLQKYWMKVCKVKPEIEPKSLVVNGAGELKEVPSKRAVSRMTETMKKLNARFGAGAVMKFGDKPDTGWQVISTGSIGLDLALGIGGLPRGRIVEIFGWESTGKTTIALNVISNAQKQGLRCLWVDAENAFDPEYAEALGVSVNDLSYSSPSCGEEGIEIADNLITAGEIDVVVFDSVAALIPKGELSDETGASKMGLHARLMSQACRKMTGAIAKNNALVIFINQLRMKIGVVYGNPEVTTGGMALQFYATMRLSVSRSTTEANSTTNGNGERSGNLTTVKVVKNKAANPFRTAKFNILYGVGVDVADEILDHGVELGVIKKEGNTYLHGSTKLGVGTESAKKFLKDNEGLMEEIEAEIIQSVN